MPEETAPAAAEATAVAAPPPAQPGPPAVAPARPAPTPTPPTETPRDATDPAPAGEDASKLKRALEAERAARKEAEQRAKAASDEGATRATEAEKRYQDTMDKLSTALGFKAEDTPPDPTALQRTIAERDNELGDLKSQLETLTAERDAALRERDVELAAWRAASKHGANAPALLDSRTFLRSLAAMDPTGETFVVDLDEAVKAALVANPTLSAAPTLADAAAAGIGTRGADAVSVASPGRGRLAAFHRAGAPK